MEQITTTTARTSLPAKLTRADIAEKIRYYKNRIHEITQQ